MPANHRKSRKPLKPLLGPAAAVLLAVAAAWVPMSLRLVDAQRRSLIEDLVQRADTLLASLSSSAADNLNPNLESVRLLNAMRGQAAAIMPEARSFTLTGYGLEDPNRFDYLWVSSDPHINKKVGDRQFSTANYGRVRLKDEISPEVDRLASEVNAAARARVAGLAEQADRLGGEAVKLVRTGTASPDRLKQLDRQLFEVVERIYFELQDIRGKARSFPPLDPRRPPRELADSYLFYLPVVYRLHGEDAYFRGAVRLEVSTDRLRAALASSRRHSLVESAVVAFVAFGLGLVLVFFTAGNDAVDAAAPAARRRRGARLRVRKEERA
jgi:hypothetical protein